MSYLAAPAPTGLVQENGRSGIALISASPGRTSSSPSSSSSQFGLTRPPRSLLPLSSTLSATMAASAAEMLPVYVKPNLMFDPRVYRGGTAGNIVRLAPGLRDAAAPAAPAASTAPRRLSKSALVRSGQIRPSLPSVAHIHAHIVVVKRRVEVPLHLYLVEQSVPIVHRTVLSQTDAMMSEPPAPSYIPRKSGLDAHTQVDLALVFNFDRESSGLVEVLAGKILEQSLMEVREEEEMSAMQFHADELECKYAREEARAEGRLAEEVALFESKERKLRDARVKNQHILSIRSKLSARYFSHHFLSALLSTSLSDLAAAGYFRSRDSGASALEATYMPSLLSSVDLNLSKVHGGRQLLQEIIGGSLVAMQAEAAAVADARAKAQAESARLRAEDDARVADRANRERPIQLFVHTSIVPAALNPIGPIHLTGNSTAKDIEDKVFQWMIDHLASEYDDPDDEQTRATRIPHVPKRDTVQFLWTGQVLAMKDNKKSAYDIGIQNMANLTMESTIVELTEEQKIAQAAADIAAKAAGTGKRRVNAEGEDDENGEFEIDENDDGEEEEEEEEEQEEDE